MTVNSNIEREHFLWVLSLATFLIFFQAYMVAPLVPRLSFVFGVPAASIALMVPAYMIPYGVSTLFYGLISDRLGRRPIMFASLLAFVILTALTATAWSAEAMIWWRLLTGIGASGVVPLALALVGDLYPYEKRGRPLGWLFGAMAGGMAFGSTVGVRIEPLIGWRALFICVAILGAAVVALLLPYRSILAFAIPKEKLRLADVFQGYLHLITRARGARTYGYVLLNAIFHSGVYTWLGLYFARGYHLGEIGIGLALLGYGVPGWLLGPVIGRAADRWGRRWLVPAGLAVAASSVACLIVRPPLLGAGLAVMALSLGYDMTQPLLAGIVTSLDPKRGGQAMGLNVFMLFTGFGLGSYLFGLMLPWGFRSAFGVFCMVQFIAAIAALALLRDETAARSKESPSQAEVRISTM
jgi:predicted MFS family arabinose efflux permease